MKLLVKWIDMRGGYIEQVVWRTEIIDEETGREVGFVDAERSPARRHVSLFGGKYQGDFKSHEECDAFAKGVEAVLSHLTAFDDDKAETAEAA